jgi:hypothetical protein
MHALRVPTTLCVQFENRSPVIESLGNKPYMM